MRHEGPFPLCVWSVEPGGTERPATYWFDTNRDRREFCLANRVRIRFPTDPEKMVRASGDCVCEVCGKLYYDHPHTQDVTTDGTPFLHQICTGLIVKL